jgi:hypothetical protein
MKRYINNCYFKNMRTCFSTGFLTVIFISITPFFTKNASAEQNHTEQKKESSVAIKKNINPNLKQVNGFENLGTFKSWEAFSMITLDEVVCWISADNVKSSKDTTDNPSKDKKSSSLMLSIRLENKERDEFSYHSQYNLEAETKLNMVIDKVVGFKLSPQGHWAWLKSTIDESRFVLAAQKGTNLVLSGKTTKDKPFTETYSLSGFTAAYKTAFDACQKELEKNKP